MAASNNNVRRYLLLAVMVIVGLLFVRQYLPMIEIPTDGRIKEEEQRLQSRLGDLAVQKKMNEDWEKELVQLRGKATMFWVRVRQGIPVEQEVLEEFNKITTRAIVNITSRESRPLKNPNSNYIQEVELKIELRSVSMREFSRLLKEISQNRRKFYWVYCTINPDNAQKPTGIRVSGRLRAYVLTDEGTRLLGSAPVEQLPETGKPSEPQRVVTTKGAERKTRLSSPPSTPLRTIGNQNKGNVK